MTEFEEMETYLHWMETHGRKDLTVKDYRLQLTKVLRLLKNDGRPYLVREIRDEDIFWLDSMLSETASEPVRHQYLRRLGNMSLLLSDVDIVKKAGIMHNGVATGCKTYFITKDQFATLYRSADETMKIILILGAYLGLRRAEIASIKESDIHGNTVVIHGKGHGPQGKVRTMTMPPSVLEEIDRYRAYKEKDPWGHEGIYLVEGGRGRKARHGITPSTIGRKMNDLKRETGIEFSTHSLRRLFATTAYYESDAKLVTIKNMLGHSKAETTYNRYIAPSKILENEAQNQIAGVLDSALGLI